MPQIARRFCSVGEPRFLQLLDDVVGLTDVHDAISKIIAAADGFVAGDLDECDGLGVAGLEADRCAGRNIEAEAVGAGTVEGEEGVGFDEVVVRSNLILSSPGD
jgi:hypothetical protein